MSMLHNSSTCANRTPRALFVRCGLAGRALSAFSIVLLGILGVVMATDAQEEDRPTVEPAQARRAATLIHARCAVCHTTDLIVQQRLPPDRWQVTVEKMRHWGADLSKEEAAAVLQFVTARYHPGAPDHVPSIEEELALTAPAEALSQASDGPLVGVPGRGAEVFARNCQACHGEGAMGGAGPKLARNRILKNEEAFWETVLHGRGPMPAWGAVLSHQDIADIHAWLSTR